MLDELFLAFQDDEPLATAKAFVQRYQQRFGSAPGMFALEGYDAATAFLDAIRAGKTTPADVNQYLSTVQFTGLSRPVHFGPNGENTARPLYLYKVKNSTFTFLGDAATSPR